MFMRGSDIQKRWLQEGVSNLTLRPTLCLCASVVNTHRYLAKGVRIHHRGTETQSGTEVRVLRHPPAATHSKRPRQRPPYVGTSAPRERGSDGTPASRRLSGRRLAALA